MKLKIGLKQVLKNCILDLLYTFRYLKLPYDRGQYISNPFFDNSLKESTWLFVGDEEFPRRIFTFLLGAI